VDETHPGKCPVCGSEKQVILNGPRSAHRYIRCSTCSHARLFPLPTSRELAAYYNNTYQVPEASHFATAEREFQAIASIVSPKFHVGAKLLEIGCSYGGMLAKFAARGWNVEGIELDGRAAAIARERLGLLVHEGDVERVRTSLSPPYDVVTAYHVIEHIIQPEEFLERVHDLCAPDGLIVLRLPNGSSLGARATRGWWEWSLIPEHVHLFSARSISLLLAKTGFQIQKMISRRGDANTLLFELANAVGKKIWHARRHGNAQGPPSAFPRLRPSETKLFDYARRALNFAGLPIDALVGIGSFGETYPLPELLVSAALTRRIQSGSE
jgi:2-polyprenyl-3-methyl-5-hydroxy-6-metoxy-1,4-benzoquinol methylase